MLKNGKKISWLVVTLLPLFLFAACGREDVQHIITYSAGANGTIKGESRQSVKQGRAGSRVRAVPADGYHFVRWSDGLTTADRTDSGVSADLAVEAVFAINQYTLLYSGGENGVIEGMTNQTVNYGEDGSPVTAIPSEHYHFAGWSDGEQSPIRTDRKVTGDIEVKANFAIDQFTLRYLAGENGTVEGESEQTVDYGGAGKLVTAVPSEGYHFVGWSDGLPTAARTDSEVMADLSLTATFASSQITLSYIAGKNGTIEGAAIQGVNYGEGGSQVTAVPAEHYQFAGWSDGVQSASRTDSKVTENISVTANFEIDRYTLSYIAGEYGSIEGVGTQEVDHGGSGSPVRAVPASGYHFIGWSDGITTANRIDSNVKADFSVSAAFAVNQYILTYTAGKNGMIEGPAQQTVNYGSNGSEVKAVAEKGFHFTGWSDGQTTAQRLDTNIKGDLSVNASFAVNTYSIGGSISGLVEGTRLILQNNDGDDLVITTNGDFNFATELLSEESYRIEIQNQPTAPNQTCTVSGGTGKVSADDVTNVVVTCVLNTYTVGGSVFGLPEGNKLILRNNDNDDLTINANGAFTFATPLVDHGEYYVTVFKQPGRPNWACTIEKAEGSLRGVNVTDIVVDCYPEAVLQAKAGIKKIKLNWNSDDFLEMTANQVTFNLCRAQEEIAAGSFEDCRNLKQGVIESGVKNNHTASPLTNDIPFWFQLEVVAASGRRTLSKIVKAIPFGGLNDTGIDWCADDTINRYMEGMRGEKRKSCDSLAASHPGQDAFNGRDNSARDRKLSKTGGGTAGFDFTKICRGGDAAGEGECPPNPSLGDDVDEWACIRDNVTGLIWEVKTADEGLRDQSFSYTWYNTNYKKNGGDPGAKNGGNCKESECDTQAFVKAVNAQGLCGASDWRLPTRKELLSILNNGKYNPAIDTIYFPNSPATHYWSSSPFAEDGKFAWQVDFKYGETNTSEKFKSNHVRLVRGRTKTFGMQNP